MELNDLSHDDYENIKKLAEDLAVKTKEPFILPCLGDNRDELEWVNDAEIRDWLNKNPNFEF